MSITEHKRNQVHNKLTDVIGREEADAVMEMLPPAGWADVATKQDLAATKQDIDARFTALKQDIEHLARQTNAQFEHMERQADTRFDLLSERIEASEHRMTAKLAETEIKINETEKRLLLAMLSTMLVTVFVVSGLAFAAAGLT